ncbi:TetR/AcrR family transcriptional regulator [Agrococcus jejuensis]|uniref:Regulatory protein, tetR family n=1 Tax=Agrococcus jejuensis TaxID=399736 RepID=A0A1G8F7C9_9MICO|nr:TetR/AcrR family transcriptional regulator [Agrococcus jejuensis]SDH78018.1 regulatory protein, tetR family [Agrococcus jejuensis]
MTDEGLRARKRRRTSAAIQRAALELALERGDLHPPVDAIASRADVSPRTFFNYFATRDEALVGEPMQFPDDADPTVGTDLLDMLETISLQVLGDRELDRDLILLRRDVMRQHPELFARRVVQSHEIEQQLIRLAERRAALDGTDRPHERGRIAALVAMGALRAGWMRWVDRAGGESLEDAVRATFDEVRTMVRTAVVV